LVEPSIRRVSIDPVGPEVLALRDILLRLGQWLGLPPARIMSVPQFLVRFAARLGDVFGGGPLSTTAIRQMEYGNTASVERFTAVTGIVPQSFETALRRHPAEVQDRWHARLYFVRPLLRGALAILWLASGVIGLAASAGDMAGLLTPLVPPAFAPVLVWLSCVLDLAIGVGLLVRWRPAQTSAIQIATILGYTVVLTALHPALWLDPFGPLLKNVPILAVVLALAAMETDR